MIATPTTAANPNAVKTATGTIAPSPRTVLGVCPVLETPFTADGAVDLAGFERLIDHQLAAGIRTVMFPGFASEFYKLSDAEREALTALLIERFHRVPETTVVISIPDHSTRIAVQNARRAVELGADMINLLPPHQFGPSGAAVHAHLTAVLDAIGSTPAVLQYAPAQTGTALDAPSIARMATASPNLVQVKVESTPPGQLISALAAQTPPLRSVVGYAGVQLIDALRRGADGVQPGSSFPEIYLEIWRLWSTGDQAAAIALHTRLLPYLSYWMQSVELIIQVEKRISSLRGIIDSDHCRAPARALDDEESAMIVRFLAEFADLLGRTDSAEIDTADIGTTATTTRTDGGIA